MNYLFCIILFMTSNLLAQNVSELSKSISDKEKNSSEVKKGESAKVNLLQEEKEKEVINYSNIKNVLDTDGLAGHKKNKDQDIEKIKKLQKELKKAKYAYPKNDDFWSFMSEYWLVKNAQKLQWDISRPSYGIKEAFQNLLEKLGYYKKRFKVLIVNSPDITHIGLPSNNGEIILLLSLPFIRTLDLTKVDITLLLLEDFLRVEEGLFVENIDMPEEFLGGNFSNDKSKMDYMKKISESYSRIIYTSGFTFQQQYKVTKTMDRILKSVPALWSAYVKLLNKIDRLVKVNLMYKGYNNIYPSPELQIKWLTPKKKVI
jgi:hypothetical protein